MATMSNAERQRRFRERRKSQLENDPGEISRLLEENARLRAALRMQNATTVVLTPEQEYQRGLIIGDLLSDRSWARLPRKKPPTFMGMTRESWMHAQPELVEYFGLTKAIETAGRLMQLELHSNVVMTGRRVRTTKKHVAMFGR
jgi:hypothetical protein